MFRFAASSLPVTLRQMGLVAMACSMAALSACGGGSRAKAYQPDRIVSFGDENSLIEGYSHVSLKDSTNNPNATLQGLVYTINTAGTTTAVVCPDSASPNFQKCTDNNTVASTLFTTTASTDYVVFPGASANFLTKIEHQTSPSYQKVTETVYSCNYSTIWIQVIAHDFGKGFKDTQCPSDSLSGATTYASYKAKVAGVATQVAAHRGELGAGVLVTLMAGQWDILEVYNAVQNNTMTQASAEAELKNRAGTLANVVKDIISTGAKVVLGLTPDLGQSPLVATGGNQALLADLTKVFNDTLYITNLGNQSGRELAGVNPEPFTNPTIRSTAYVYNVAACDAAQAKHPDAVAAVESDADLAVKFCTASTLVSTTTAYMWADNTHFTPAGHSLIGSAGYNRAYNQF